MPRCNKDVYSYKWVWRDGTKIKVVSRFLGKCTLVKGHFGECSHT